MQIKKIRYILLIFRDGFSACFCWRQCCFPPARTRNPPGLRSRQPRPPPRQRNRPHRLSRRPNSPPRQRPRRRRPPRQPRPSRLRLKRLSRSRRPAAQPLRTPWDPSTHPGLQSVTGLAKAMCSAGWSVLPMAACRSPERKSISGSLDRMATMGTHTGLLCLPLRMEATASKAIFPRPIRDAPRTSIWQSMLAVIRPWSPSITRNRASPRRSWIWC